MQEKIKIINTQNAAPAGGHYVQATSFGNLVFVSGQLPVRPDGTHIFSGSFDVQARQAINNLLEILKEAGSSTSQILKVTVYIVGVEYWPEFNKIYAEILGDVKPARAIVPVPELHHGYLVEIDAIAAVL